jgi:hypothetical protein
VKVNRKGSSNISGCPSRNEALCDADFLVFAVGEGDLMLVHHVKVPG